MALATKEAKASNSGSLIFMKWSISDEVHTAFTTVEFPGSNIGRVFLLKFLVPEAAIGRS
jgi:hypothetical protein